MSMDKIKKPNAQEVFDIFPSHYQGVNLILWIIFTVELFVISFLFFRKSLKIKLEVDGDSIQEVEWFGNLGFSFVSTRR